MSKTKSLTTYLVLVAAALAGLSNAAIAEPKLTPVGEPDVMGVQEAHVTATVHGVPVSVKLVANVVEKISAEQAKTITPAWIESLLLDAAERAVQQKISATMGTASDLAAIRTADLQALQVAPPLTVISPTVGRKVWYRPNAADIAAGMQVAGEQPLDATIIAVWSDRCINALITDVVGQQFTRRSWPLKQDGDAIAEGESFLEWMPYQAAQAAKATA